MLKLQYFGHQMWKTDSLKKTLMLGKTEDKRRREWWRVRWLDSITDSVDMNLSKLRESEGQGSLTAVHGVAKSWTQLRVGLNNCWWVGLCPRSTGCLAWGIQLWSLEAVGWGQVSLAKWSPPGWLMSMNSPLDLRHQCSCPTVCHSHPLPPQESLQDPQIGLAPILVVFSGSQSMWNLVYTLRGRVSVFFFF